MRVLNNLSSPVFFLREIMYKKTIETLFDSVIKYFYIKNIIYTIQFSILYQT